MKRINKIILLATTVVTPFAGCDTDEFRDLNIDPNAAKNNQFNVTGLISNLKNLF